MQMVSLGWGMAAFVFMLVSFFPHMAVLNWVNLPLAAVGLLVSALVMVRSPGLARGPALAGVVTNLIALAIVVIGLATNFATL